MDLITFILSSIILIIFFKWMKKSKIDRMIDELPGPKGLPLFGNILEIVTPRESKCKKV